MKPNADDLIVYIKSFIKKTRERLERGEIALVMIYDDADPRSYLQFKHFKNGKPEDVPLIDQILPVEWRSDFGQRFIRESLEYSEKMNKTELRIDFTPTFINFKTHEIVLVGVHVLKDLKEVLRNMT